MKNQRGFSLIGFLVFIAILAIFALVTIPVLLRITWEARVLPFKEAFGITLPVSVKHQNDPLTDEQRLILKPLVLKRLGELCNADNDPPQPTVTDPVNVQKLLDDKTDRAQKCEKAKAIAQREGIVPSTPQ